MKIEDILQQPSMPIAGPSYPPGPYRFVDREYFIVTYLSDPDAIAEAVPEPLMPDGSNTVLYEYIRMPDSSGFGDYTESGIVIPCKFGDEKVNFVAQMYLDCEPPIAGGREIWGFPKKHANAKLIVASDTLTGTLVYAGQQVSMGTMGYKHNDLMLERLDSAVTAQQAMVDKLSKTHVNLKLIPNVDGSLGIAQLVAFNLTDIQVKGAWSGPARLHLIPHVNAPVADLPVRKVIGGSHFIADLTLPYDECCTTIWLISAKIKTPTLTKTTTATEFSCKDERLRFCCNLDARLVCDCNSTYLRYVPDYFNSLFSRLARRSPASSTRSCAMSSARRL